MTEELQVEKERLIERLGVHIECRDKVAPLAARIMAAVILTGKKGQTFDELVEGLGASKSTISTHLNALQGSNRITYFTKTGDRKKYFIINPDGMMHALENMVVQWEREKNLHKEIVDFKSQVNAHLDDDEKFDFDIHSEYLGFLEEATSSVEKLCNKLNENKTK